MTAAYNMFLNILMLIMKLVLYKWLFLILQKEVSLMHFDFVIILSVSFYTSSFWLFDRTK